MVVLRRSAIYLVLDFLAFSMHWLDWTNEHWKFGVL